MRNKVTFVSIAIALAAMALCLSCTASTADAPAVPAAPAATQPTAPADQPAPDQPVLDETYAATAVVTWVGLEGGFWGLVTASDKARLDPMKPIPPEFRKDGLRVKIRYIPRKDLASFHMWGMVIDLRLIERIE